MEDIPQEFAGQEAAGCGEVGNYGVAEEGFKPSRGEDFAIGADVGDELSAVCRAAEGPGNPGGDLSRVGGDHSTPPTS